MSCMAPTSLRTDDEINIFHQCAQLGGKYIVSTNLLCYECIPHRYEFVITWLMVVSLGFSGPDPLLCSQVADRSVFLTRHIMHRVQK